MTIPASLPVTSLYAGVLGIAFALTSLRVGVFRANCKKFYGALAGSDLEHFSRSAGTIGELGFPGLLLLALLEYNSVLPQALLWWVGLVFTVARISHSVQLASPQKIPIAFRMYGFLVTVAIFTLSSLALLLGKAKN